MVGHDHLEPVLCPGSIANGRRRQAGPLGAAPAGGGDDPERAEISR